MTMFVIVRIDDDVVHSGHNSPYLMLSTLNFSGYSVYFDLFLLIY